MSLMKEMKILKKYFTLGRKTKKNFFQQTLDEKSNAVFLVYIR